MDQRGNEMKEKSITEIIESIKEDICDKYCKYPCMTPPDGKDEDWLTNDQDSPCNTCPLLRL